MTAGNASSINDGAAAVVVTSAEFAAAHGLPVLARIRGWGVAGVDPAIMGIGPVPATQKALAMAGWTLEVVDLIEANEARILTTLLYGLKRRDVARGLATLCVGGGMGVSLLVER